jgi:hypothetical protein
MCHGPGTRIPQQNWTGRSKTRTRRALRDPMNRPDEIRLCAQQQTPWAERIDSMFSRVTRAQEKSTERESAFAIDVGAPAAVHVLDQVREK